MLAVSSVFSWLTAVKKSKKLKVKLFSLQLITMSDFYFSDSNISSSSKRRLRQIDDNIEYLTQVTNNCPSNNFEYKTEFECSLMTVKMKRQKVKALSAVAESQALLANMEVLVAECDLFTDIEKLRNFKKTKIDPNIRSEGELQVDTHSPPLVTPAPTSTTVAVQTTKSMADKKIKRRHDSSIKLPLDISSDETMSISPIHESRASLQTSSKSFSPGLNAKRSANYSDSEMPLSSSINAEFNKPYTKHTQELVQKYPNTKHQSEKCMPLKCKSKYASKHTHSPTVYPKKVAELRKITAYKTASSSHAALNSTGQDAGVQDLSSCAPCSPKISKTGDEKSSACATNVPVRHSTAVLTNLW